jgi:hypothetical protein
MSCSMVWDGLGAGGAQRHQVTASTLTAVHPIPLGIGDVPKITKELLEAHIFKPSPFFAGKFVSDTK